MTTVNMPYSDDLEVSGKQGSYAPNDYSSEPPGAPRAIAFNQFDTVIKGDSGKTAPVRDGYTPPAHPNYGKAGCCYKYCACMLPCWFRLKNTCCIKKWKLTLAILAVLLIAILIIVLPIVFTLGDGDDKADNSSSSSSIQFRSDDDDQVDQLLAANANATLPSFNDTQPVEPDNEANQTIAVAFPGGGKQPYPIIGPPDNVVPPAPGIQPYRPQPFNIPPPVAPGADEIEGRSGDGDDFGATGNDVGDGASDNVVDDGTNSIVVDDGPPPRLSAADYDRFDNVLDNAQPPPQPAQDGDGPADSDSAAAPGDAAAAGAGPADTVDQGASDDDSVVDQGVLDNTIVQEDDDLPVVQLQRCEAQNERGFACADSPGRRVRAASRCDGVQQCADGSDELDCDECVTPTSCPAVAGNGQQRVRCLRGAVFCDGRDHGCANQSLLTGDTYCGRACHPVQEHRCAGVSALNTSVCLPVQLRCDGAKDCAQGDDEMGCEPQDCTAGSRWCAPSSTCVPASSVCDGVRDCDDASDELQCSCGECYGSSVALCASGRCLAASQVCDGQLDCEDGEDESPECAAQTP